MLDIGVEARGCKHAFEMALHKVKGSFKIFYKI